MIAKDKVVSMHYRLTNNDGEVLDSSEGRDPLNYLHGHGNIVPGLEKEMEGKAVGDEFDVVVPPAEGYGEHQEEAVAVVPREQINLPDIKEGMKLQAQSPQGPIPLKVVKVTDEEVTVDSNHELAGVTLNFHIEVVEIRDAEQVELDHGHAH